MDHTRFDQLVRTFGKTRTRRGLLAAAAGVAALAVKPARANQLLPATCAQTGQVCTILYGCCSGLTCATSSINPSYGVCVPGEGGMVTTGTSLVVPFDASDTSQAQSVADSVTNTTSTTTTSTIDDREAEREAREAERDARKAQVDARRDTRKANLETRRDAQKQRREDAREAADIADGPNLSFQVFNAGATGGRAEVVQVINNDSVNARLTQIESLRSPEIRDELSTPYTLRPGETFIFRSGVGSSNLPNESNPEPAGQDTWTAERICSDADQDDGFVVSAEFATSSSSTTRFVVYCDNSLNSGSAPATSSGSDARRRRRRKSRNSQRSSGGQKSRGKGK